MSLYNMINGFSLACILFMPMLGRKQEDYPRFRNCFLSNDKTKIEIYTRVGGNNRNCGFGEEELYKDPLFVTTYDDDFDNTYATYVFNVPDKWKSDFKKIVNGEIKKVSDEYFQYVSEFYPKLAKTGVIKAIFRSEKKGE